MSLIHAAIEERWQGTAALLSLVPLRRVCVGNFPSYDAMQAEPVYPLVTREVQSEQKEHYTSNGKIFRTTMLFRIWSNNHEDGQAVRSAFWGLPGVDGFENQHWTTTFLQILKVREEDFGEFQDDEGVWSFFMSVEFVWYILPTSAIVGPVNGAAAAVTPIITTSSRELLLDALNGSAAVLGVFFEPGFAELGPEAIWAPSSAPNVSLLPEGSVEMWPDAISGSALAVSQVFSPGSVVLAPAAIAGSAAVQDATIILTEVLMYSQTDDATIDNSAAPTALVSTGEGTITVAANTQSAGDKFIIEAAGWYKTKATAPGSLTIELKVGAELTMTFPAIQFLGAQDGERWFLRASITRRSIGPAGVVRGHGILWANDASPNPSLIGTGGDVAVPTDAPKDLGVFGTFSLADVDNEFHVEQLDVQHLAV